MSVVVAVETSRSVWMGADSAISGENTKAILSDDDKKIWKSGPCLIGSAGNWSMIQCLKHGLDLPRLGVADPPLWLAKTFIPHARQVLKDGGFGDTMNEVDLIVAVSKRLFVLESITNLYRVRDRFYAIGNGYEVAMGNLDATVNVGNPKQRILMALKSATYRCLGVEPPFHFEVQE